MSSNPSLHSLCTLCGLLCDAEQRLEKHCARYARWVASAPTQPRESQSSLSIDRLANIDLSQPTLIWLDACDVQTTRAAVRLARRAGATIHVGQSTGSHAVKSVMASDGWLGTTLSEVASRADLVVTLGDGLRSGAPLVAPRFFRSTDGNAKPRWLHVTPHTPSDHDECNVSPDELLRLPREQWYETLSLLAMHLLRPTSLTPIVAAFARQLQQAKHTVWLWDVDEFHFQTDELIVRRLLSIARLLNEQSRCTLLPLDLNVGRVTAEETLLWLTGCSTTATWNGTSWHRPLRYDGYSLEQWSNDFATILLINNLPSDHALPNLQTQLTLQSTRATCDHEIQVAAVGVDCSGHLFRGDRGTVHFLTATQPASLPMAASLLEQLGASLSSSSTLAENGNQERNVGDVLC